MKLITLSDGSKLEVKINWLTLKLLAEENLDSIDVDNLTGFQELEATTSIIYAILRSNGKKIDKDEALSLIPVEDETIFELFKQFQDKMEVFKKKMEGMGLTN